MALVLVLAVIALIWLLTAGGLLSRFSTTNNEEPIEQDLSTIMSFEDCEAAGFPIRESHPRQCALPDGRVYAEEIVVNPTYENASADMIEVFSPEPGGVVGKEFLVVGKARGNWYFEGSFPIVVIGQDGNQIGAGIATATDEWMTTDFVEFKTDLIDLPSAYMGPATLILRKDNPSGLPENDASISIPIVVEY